MGSHYGVKIRKQEQLALGRQRANYECPVCAKPSVKRCSYSVWLCRSCGAKIAGGAYSLETDVGVSAKKALVSAKPM